MLQASVRASQEIIPPLPNPHKSILGKWTISNLIGVSSLHTELKFVWVWQLKPFLSSVSFECFWRQPRNSTQVESFHLSFSFHQKVSFSHLTDLGPNESIGLTGNVPFSTQDFYLLTQSLRTQFALYCPHLKKIKLLHVYPGLFFFPQYYLQRLKSICEAYSKLVQIHPETFIVNVTQQCWYQRFRQLFTCANSAQNLRRLASQCRTKGRWQGFK